MIAVTIVHFDEDFVNKFKAAEGVDGNGASEDWDDKEVESEDADDESVEDDKVDEALAAAATDNILSAADDEELEDDKVDEREEEDDKLDDETAAAERDGDKRSDNSGVISISCSNVKR